MLNKPVTIRLAKAEDVSFIKEMMWEATSPIMIRAYGAGRQHEQQDHHWAVWLKDPKPVFIAEDAGGHKLGAISAELRHLRQ